MNSGQVVVAALYEFRKLDNLEDCQQTLLNICSKQKIKGTLLLGLEGINGTMAGSREAIDQLKLCLNQLGFNCMNYKESFCETVPFLRLKVKVKAEIVTIGDVAVDPKKLVGQYVEPRDWNELLKDPEVFVLDTRNDYEVAIGSFSGAVDPKTKNFREFPAYVQQKLDPAKHKKIAMYCTGGIRCEKASSYMLEHGFDEVYHLKGGVLKYIEEVREEESLWQGDCFVFDERVAVNNKLEPSEHRQCFGCRHPLTKSEWQDDCTILGVCCPYCVSDTTVEQKKRYAERQKQIDLAKGRGENHLGASDGGY